MRREFDINVGFVPVPEDAQQQEEEQFFIIDNQGEAAPPSLQCPKSIEEMMRIVQEMSCQRAEHMNSFTYNARAPILRSRGRMMKKKWSSRRESASVTMTCWPFQMKNDEDDARFTSIGTCNTMEDSG